MWSEEGPCYIIAEAGSNHDGDFGKAMRLIHVAADAGADCVKFQAIPPFEREWTGALYAEAMSRGLYFAMSVFDTEAIRYLDQFNVPFIKIASAELVNLELVEAAMRTNRPLIFSTGMAAIEEIDAALTAARVLGDEDVALLQCTTRYPTPPSQVNLQGMETLRQRYGLAVGLSDHSEGIAVPIAATALGARIIEKHFTLDRSLPGPDHHYALEPEELKAMVEAIRTVEEAMGDGRKGPQEGEALEARGRSLTWT